MVTKSSEDAKQSIRRARQKVYPLDACFFTPSYSEYILDIVFVCNSLLDPLYAKCLMKQLKQKKLCSTNTLLLLITGIDVVDMSITSGWGVWEVFKFSIA